MPKTSTRASLLAAAHELVVGGDGRLPSADAVARRAGVSRLTVYHHFGSVAALMSAVAAAASSHPVSAADAPPVDALRRAIGSACERWAADPALFRRLPAAAAGMDEARVHALASALANADRLRPGCSVREAEDVISVAMSFPTFDRLHQDGRRSVAAVSEILNRIAATVLA